MRNLLIAGAALLMPLASSAAAPADPPIEERLANPDAAVRRAAVDAVLARPEAVNPFHYALVSQALWGDGKRLQAAFWFYLFQARTRPWSDADTQDGGIASLRGALNQTIGPTINGWIGSDLPAWQALVRRALDYEARLPLASDRPDGIGEAEWRALVEKDRREYRAGFEQTVGSAKADDIAAQRRGNGLPVGPLDMPGPDLPESWR